MVSGLNRCRRRAAVVQLLQILPVVVFMDGDMHPAPQRRDTQAGLKMRHGSRAQNGQPDGRRHKPGRRHGERRQHGLIERRRFDEIELVPGEPNSLLPASARTVPEGSQGRAPLLRFRKPMQGGGRAHAGSLINRMPPRVSTSSKGKQGVLFENKEPKNFCDLGPRSWERPASWPESFLLLFFKKEDLPSYLKRVAKLSRPQPPP